MPSLLRDLVQLIFGRDREGDCSRELSSKCFVCMCTSQYNGFANEAKVLR